MGNALTRPPQQKDLTFIGKVDDVDRAEKTLTVKVSTDTRDRDDEVILPRGIGLKNYRNNPVVLWAHKYDQPPIAKSLWEKTQKDCLLSKPKFAATEFAQGIFDLYADDFLRAWSIGFMPVGGKFHQPTEDDLKARPDWAGVRRIYDECDMLEYSACPVPSNPNALRLALGKGLWLPPELKALAGRMEKGHTHDHTQHHDPPEWKDVDQSKLPRKAFADPGDPTAPPTWMYAHHHVEGATKEGEHGRHTDGTLYLHVEGLKAARDQAVKDGASSDVMEHLNEHCEKVGMPTTQEHYEDEHDQEDADKAAEILGAKCGVSEGDPCGADGAFLTGQKPYPSEHAARMREPGDFDEKSFRRINDKFGKGIHAIFGKLKGDDSMTLQAIRFDAAKFTVEQAKKWLTEHKLKPIKFEPAEKPESDDGKMRILDGQEPPKAHMPKIIALEPPAKPTLRVVGDAETLEIEEQARLRGKMTVGAAQKAR